VRNCLAAMSKPFNIGLVLQEAVGLHQQGRLRDAEKLYTRALKSSPDNFDALHLLGLVKAQSGQMGEAYRLMSSALKVKPDAPDALINFANVLHALKRNAEALQSLDKALAIRPGDLEALLYRGNVLSALNRSEDALACFDAVLQRSPGNRDALLNRGTTLATLGRHAQALVDFEAVLAQAPNQVDALYNRGTALLDLNRATDAIAAFDRVLNLVPKHLRAWNNRGRALQMLNQHEEAVSSFEKAITIEKDYADAHSNMALSLLTLGDLPRGFAEYEWRWKRRGMSDTRRNYRGRPWLGEFPLGNRTILLPAEQGLGDTIQFARYAPLLARAGAKVVLEVQPELKTLLATMDGIDSCHARGEALPPYDVYCPLGSLPLALKTQASTVPADVPYLRADDTHIAKWQSVIEVLPGKRVAIAWAGHTRHPNDINRSVDFALLEPLFAVDGISFISIQRELRGNDAALIERHRTVIHVGSDLNDIADTAAILALADLTISVDTSVAHLAGAMGRDTWVMLPFSPDWRWTLTGARSPWYPQLQLYRQPAPGDWPSVIATVRDTLRRAVRND